jgi:hypothetical protein
MRKSSQVPITILAAVAAIAVVAISDDGCNGPSGPRSCVDAQSHLAPDANCKSSVGSGYHFVYGGSSGGHFGDIVIGASESGVSRGGFGHGGGEGGE